MPVELIEGFQEYAAGLPNSGLQLVIWPDGSVTMFFNDTPSVGTVVRQTSEHWEDVATAAAWFTDQGYGVQA